MSGRGVSENFVLRPRQSFGAFCGCSVLGFVPSVLRLLLLRFPSIRPLRCSAFDVGCSMLKLFPVFGGFRGCHVVGRKMNVRKTFRNVRIPDTVAAPEPAAGIVRGRRCFMLVESREINAPN